MARFFRISLDGLQEVPGVASTATGYGYALYENTGFSETLWYRIFLTGLDYSLVLPESGPFPVDISDDVTGIHFHSGARGTNGEVVFNIQTEDPNDLNLSESGGVLTIEGQWDALDPASTPLDFFSVPLGNAIVGNDVDLYVNVHTTGNPAGEIRGQFVALSDDEANTITGTPELDYLYGLGGGDTLEGLGGPDLLDGGEGSDTASYASSGQEVSINLATGTATGGDAEGDALVSIENLIGTSRTDGLFGDANDNVLEGGDGADDIQGEGGSDTASYASSDAGVTINLETEETTGGDATGDILVSIENLTGSTFADDLTGDDTANRLEGLDQNDTLAGLAGADTLLGGDGIDTADYSASPDAIAVDLGAGTATGGDAEDDSLSGIENLEGSEFADDLRGNDDANLINGLGGDDTIEGGGGGDTLDGGTGANTLSYGGSAAGVTVNLLENLTSGGDAAGDDLRNFVHILGSLFADDLTGDAQNNQLRGGTGNDVLDGGAGLDTALFSGLFADAEITFGAEQVIVSSVDGVDTLTGIEQLQFDDQTVSTDGLAPVPTVAITGSATQRETLTAVPANTSAIDTSTIAYQWLRDGVDIAGATADSYSLTQNDVGQPVSVRMSYTDTGGTQTVSSTPTAAVANVNDAPTGAPEISGAAHVGNTLTADTSGIDDADGLGTFSYQWQRDGADIDGATGATYELTGADLGEDVSVAVSFTDGQGTDETLTSTSETVQPRLTILVTTTSDTLDPDDGVLSLREAIIQVNAEEGPDSIQLVPLTYTLSLDSTSYRNAGGFDDRSQHLSSEGNARDGDIDIHGDLTLLGAPSGGTLVANTMGTRAFHVHSEAQVYLSDFRIDGGERMEPLAPLLNAQDGGALLNTGGDITIHEMDFTRNQMYAEERVTYNSLAKKSGNFTNAPSEGGAIFNASRTIEITDSLFSGNMAVRGGAISAASGEISIASTQFDQNAVYNRWQRLDGHGKHGFNEYENAGQGAAIYSNPSAQVNVLSRSGTDPTGENATSFTNNTVSDGSGTLIDGNVYLEDLIDVTGKGNNPEALGTGVTRDAPLTRGTLASSLVASAIAAATAGEAVLTRLAGAGPDGCGPVRARFPAGGQPLGLPLCDRDHPAIGRGAVGYRWHRA
ncbi:CHRD domain-containing protein [Aliisedimentitalea scapharcae]|uniref:CHRD domain-containing protein n=1 Tax=Aliisedimentitalea scapharcae TaxID=1524259 RepID=A0ABZ2XSH7_9RHOB